ncbi:Tic20-like protein [Xenococcus sp. PCC 7305]|uniref:Tic20 family protein n=1 Tax=Xenococcus sp. PCC 7305 TaxID=102125 RepID=UPI0002AC4CDE|nr:Tic20 family protein [Xenococcus sp. PCC 7305]ELS03054.1 Tic20-like protein [Xenococcus sp. PCC 7305]
MTWRGSTDTKDKIFAALVYSVPLYYGYNAFGGSILRSFPRIFLTLIEIFLMPLNLIYSSLPFADFILFLVLFLAVVRNDRISHFIRFNTMQALLLYMAAILVGMGLRILGLGIIASVVNPICFTVILAVCLYSIIKSAQGSYPDIPGISPTVYNQVP